MDRKEHIRLVIRSIERASNASIPLAPSVAIGAIQLLEDALHREGGCDVRGPTCWPPKLIEEDGE